MDPLTLALLTAAITGIAEGLSEEGALAAYGRLKSTLLSRFGRKSKVMRAIEVVEHEPRSAERKDALMNELRALPVEDDRALMTSIRELVDVIAPTQPGASTQIAVGNQIAQATEGSTAEVHGRADSHDDPRQPQPHTSQRSSSDEQRRS